MLYMVVALVGFGLGALAVYFVVETRRRKAAEDRRAAEQQSVSAKTLLSRVVADQKQLAAARAEFERKREAEYQALSERVAAEEAVLAAARSELDRRIVAYDQLVAENRTLKQDLFNVGTHVRKEVLERKQLAEAQAALRRGVQDLAERYLRDVEKWVSQSVTSGNYAACKQRLEKVIEWRRSIGFEVTPAREAELIADLKKDYEEEVRKAFEREKQAQIRAAAREEAARLREVERQQEVAAREKAAVEAALAKALAEAQGVHTAQVAELEARLAEAEAQNQRALSQAQLTRAGHIYVISNIGSFGERVYKIGMTRRLDPEDRIWELSDASVPFPFDVHMMIWTDDAPALESKLHDHFQDRRINKVNPRKEFFRLDLEQVREFVVANHQEYVEKVFKEAEKDVGLVSVED
jgi:hypothetical protein